MTRQEQQINYWANMLNESIRDDYSDGNVTDLSESDDENVYEYDETHVETDEAEQLDERRMTGPTAARNGGIDEIADMRAKLDNGVVEFEFWKHDPEGGPDVIRHAVGTTSEAVVPTAERRRLDPSYDENLASYRRRENFIIWFWDLEKNAVRCFNTNRFERIINVQENPGHVAPNVERIGDIFIHRDEDPTAVPVELTPDVEERINDEIENTIDVGEALADIAFGDQNAAAFNPGFGITRAANGDPVLKIIINKQNCTDNDTPYELKLNELRQEIRRRWNVDVKRAEVTGNFRFV